MKGRFISTGVHYHGVEQIVASTHGGGVLRLTLKGDPAVSEMQFNEAEITIFTDNAAMTDRLIKAINGAIEEERVSQLEGV